MVYDYKYMRKYDLKKKYGISLEEYKKLYESQNGVCAICGKEEKRGRMLSVDHDHKSKKVRGLLCDNCNLFLGRFEKRLPLLRKTFEYLGICFIE